jgi:hypothetical protein
MQAGPLEGDDNAALLGSEGRSVACDVEGDPSALRVVCCRDDMVLDSSGIVQFAWELR